MTEFLPVSIRYQYFLSDFKHSLIGSFQTAKINPHNSSESAYKLKIHSIFQRSNIPNLPT